MSRHGVLLLRGYGISIAVERGHLCVEDGVGTKRRHGRFARTARGLRRLVVLGHSGTISFDAIRWLSDVGAAFVQIDSDGEVLAATGPIGLRDARLRRAQAKAADDGRAFAIASQLVRDKLHRQSALVDRLSHGGGARNSIDESIRRIEGASTIEELRRTEAEGAFAYWKSWESVEVSFVRIDRRRVPEHWLTFGKRSSLLTGSPRKATNPANALLNYLYAIAEAETRIAALAVGLDPLIGLMHADQGSRPSFACDLMEPVRPVVDGWLLDFFKGHTFPRNSFFETRQGVCRVMPPLTLALAETAPQWASAVAPIAERVARELLGSESRDGASARRLPTPLTQANRSAGRESHRRRPVAKQKAHRLALPAICFGCGVELARRGRRYCNACLAREHPNPMAEVLRANAEWERTAGEVPDAEVYAREVAPRISTVPVPTIMDATGLSKSYCELIRRGERVPHPRHWLALRSITIQSGA